MSSTPNVLLSNANPNSKRSSKMSSSNQSLNHLLNFTLPPRQPHVVLPRRSSRKSSGSTYGIRSTERFVNAQYRFVMKPSGDYTVHFADPDIFFQWHDVLQVIIPRTSAVAAAGAQRDKEGLLTCPICLSPPTAPRMTRCGHVFCYPCILHYLNVSDIEKWVRCPICMDSVNEKQLKSVKWFDGHSSFPGTTHDYECDPSSSSKRRKTLHMRLMQRPQITTLALPRSSTWPSEVLLPHQAPFHFLPDVFAFSKFMLATPSYLISELEEDLNSLMTERGVLESMKDDLGILFVDAAAVKVHSEIEIARAMDTESLQQAVERAQRELTEIQRRGAKSKEALVKDGGVAKPCIDVPEEFLTVKFVGSTTSSWDGISRPSRPRRNLNPPPPTSSYYYYQSASGSPIFLHPLDIRILLSHFNTYASFPNDIQVEVEAYSEGAVNDDLRKRCKYLALPEGADVVFVEADLSAALGAEALKSFEGALKTRRAKRKEKLRKDDRAKIRAEDREKVKVYNDALQWSEQGSGSSIQTQDSSSPSTRPDFDTEAGTPVISTPTPQVAGAWGSRSFATALHASPSPRPSSRVRRREEDQHDEWDMDAWDEIAQSNTGRKKQGRSKKMVILGGGPSGARRR